MAGAVEGDALPAYPLSELLDNSDVQQEINLWSLEIENGEINALRGVDRDRHRPHYVLVEVWNRSKSVFSLMKAAGYELEPGINGRDDISGWSHETNHRDFLWRDSQHKLVLLAFDSDDDLLTAGKTQATLSLSGKAFLRHVPLTSTYSAWVDQVRSHDFVICPDGTHTSRLQEVILLGSVPIVIKSTLQTDENLFRTLPIMILDGWDNLSVDSLRAWQAEQAKRPQSR